ncbi:MAG: hypothetical protein SV760_00115, partial [Halobacteria archaeon]|nr:hypothetical protein [Halobacteria archaeon]
MRVLYIGTDPSSEVAEEIRRSLGATVETVASVDGTEEAFESESEPVDCVVVDASGVEVARGVLENWKGVETRIPFVLLTDDSDEEFDETHDLRRAESRDPDDVTDVVEEAV